MRALALILEAVAGHNSTDGKAQCAAAYLAGRDAGKVGVAARFLAGEPLPPGTPATRVGRSTLVDLVTAFTSSERSNLIQRATRRGDLGIAVSELLAEQANGPTGPRLLLAEVADALVSLGSLSSKERSRRLRDLMERATPLEAKYLTKLLLGSLRTGMQTGRVEEAIALAFDTELETVRRATMLLGDVGAAAEHAASGSLDTVCLRVFRPVRSMLAHPTVDPNEVLMVRPPPLLAEDKFDGIRAQLHTDGKRSRLYSRTLEDITHFFPELVNPPEGLDGEWILDGEVVAWLNDRCLSFSALQQRLGRREVPITLLLDAPVVYLAFDALRAGGTDLVDSPLRERKEALEALPEQGSIRRVPWHEVHDVASIRAHFDASRKRGNEGSVLKDPDEHYRPGRRGRGWVKLKRPAGTLDVGVTAAEYGRGKRVGMLSDLTFAVQLDNTLVDLGKAYSGLTDSEIDEMTRTLKATTTSRDGPRHIVEPTIVLEVAFDGIARSQRHAGGFALRFPRILRQREDLASDQIDTLAEVERLYQELEH